MGLKVDKVWMLSEVSVYLLLSSADQIRHLKLLIKLESTTLLVFLTKIFKFSMSFSCILECLKILAHLYCVTRLDLPPYRVLPTTFSCQCVIVLHVKRQKQQEKFHSLFVHCWVCSYFSCRFLLCWLFTMFTSSPSDDILFDSSAKRAEKANKEKKVVTEMGDTQLILIILFFGGNFSALQRIWKSFSL